MSLYKNNLEKKNDIKVSIIIPAYNSENTIERSILSCQNQSYQNIEIIVINNLSTDNTSEIIRKMILDDNRIKFIDLPQKGRSLARNKGLDVAKGEFIQFLDSDDTIEPYKIEKSLNFLTTNNDIDAYGMSVLYVKDDKSKLYTPKLYFKNELLTHNIFPINTFVFRKNNVRFDKNQDFDEDWLFWVELFHKNNSEWRLVNELGCKVFITGNNTMSNITNMMLYETIIRGIIKKEYPVISFKIILSDLKKMLTVNILHSKGKITKRELIESQQYFPIEKNIANLFMKLPFLKSKFERKLDILLSESKY